MYHTKTKLKAWMSYFTRIGVSGMYEIRDILLHMIFQININVQNVLQKRVHTKSREAF